MTTRLPAAQSRFVDENGHPTKEFYSFLGALPQAATATPANIGTAAVGTSTRFAREDHVHGPDATAWTAFSPTITSVTGAFTSVSGAGSAYKQIGKTVWFSVTIAITTRNTDGNGIVITLPVTATGQGRAIHGINISLNKGITGFTNYTAQTNAVILLYDGTHPTTANSQFLLISGTYEAA